MGDLLLHLLLNLPSPLSFAVILTLKVVERGRTPAFAFAFASPRPTQQWTAKIFFPKTPQKHQQNHMSSPKPT